jgi:hypothetical protein|mmetsp:Transcript_27993/g.43655  ORF Transcript_27993/g.43655 Transcript_27993/m.43655 type:complete len:503 (+) Transcript_27993:87-1595(+)
MAHDLDELQRQYAALGFTLTPPATASSVGVIGSTSSNQSASKTGVTRAGGSIETQSTDLDELQRKYAALGFGNVTTPPSTTTSFGDTLRSSLPKSKDDMVETASSQEVYSENVSANGGVQDLDELRKQFDALFDTGLAPKSSTTSRPADLDLGDSERAVRTPESSSASTGTAVATPGRLATGGIDDFSVYQKFRLQMVKLFGSLASALYEIGADRETGKLSRNDFEHVLTDKLQLFSPAEAHVLFSHATNADPLDCGLGGYVSHRDFSISDEEWRTVVLAKNNEGSGTRKAIPFASGPKGSSLGLFHRAVTMDKVMSSPMSSIGMPQTSLSCCSSEAVILEPSQESLAKRSVGDALPSVQAPSTPRVTTPRKVTLKSGKRVWPWRSPQKPWEPSMMLGSDIPQQARTHRAAASRGRDMEITFRCTMPKPHYEKKYSQLGPPERQNCWIDEAAGHHVTTCPSSRSEMEPKTCVHQIKTWWPYQGPAPPPRLKSMLSKRRSLNH